MDIGTLFDLSPAREETRKLIHDATAFLPYLFTSAVITMIFSFLALSSARLGRRVAQRKMVHPLAIELIAKLFALPVFLLGIYLVLKTCGLTGIAVTIVGGTGAIGLVAGFAMKNILENYFAGILLSLRHPYTIGDVVDVAGKTGVVRELTTRGTILADFDGNHIIIPNSTIYQNVITNLSANSTMRMRFQISIAYRDSIGRARALILEVLESSPEILRDPEPLAMVEDFAPVSVKFGIYFWFHPKQSNGGKLKSQVMESVKNRLQKEGFTLGSDYERPLFQSHRGTPGTPDPALV